MKTVPILFSTEMVRAILDGTKTQTRRVVKPQPKRHHWEAFDHYEFKNKILKTANGTSVQFAHYLGEKWEIEDFALAKANIGDVFWVRETWQHTKVLNLSWDDENYGYVYRADGQPWEDFEGWTWKPSIFMPKQACRLWLKVTNIRVEKLRDISPKDALAEGISKSIVNGETIYKNYVHEPETRKHFHESRHGFASLWKSINGHESWALNPWVWVYDFKIVERPKNFING